MANSLGGISFQNSFLRNYVIAFIATFIISMILGHFRRSDYLISDIFLLIPSVLYFFFLRPMDPFKLNRFTELAPTLAINMIIGVMFSVSLSILAGSYVAYLASKIKPSEAMRHV
jgi:ABC-type lipoprotein release transport system permease subunit